MVKVLVLSFLFFTIVGIQIIKYFYHERISVLDRLKIVASNRMSLHRDMDDPLSKPFSERVIRPLLTGGAEVLSRFMPAKSRDKLQQALQFAGNPGNLKPQEFQALHYTVIVLFIIGFAFFAYLARLGLKEQIVFAIAGGVIGYLLGKVYLSSRAKRRQTSIQKELPDVLDLLTVSIEAGLGFDGALLKVTEKSKGELTNELRKTLHELQMGKGRRETLRDLGKRTGVEDLQAFVGSMIQADQLGVPVGKVIRVQGEQVRQKRRQRVEEKAMKAPVKMLIPLIFFIFPSIFIVLLGPAALQLYQTFVGGK